jgi:hypothetical protein
MVAQLWRERIHTPYGNEKEIKILMIIFRNSPQNYTGPHYFAPRGVEGELKVVTLIHHLYSYKFPPLPFAHPTPPFLSSSPPSRRGSSALTGRGWVPAPVSQHTSAECTESLNFSTGHHIPPGLRLGCTLQQPAYYSQHLAAPARAPVWGHDDR